jgi:hypothetical protein
MNPPTGIRNLKLLVGDIGASYRQRMLPRVGVIVLLIAACAVWLHASQDLLAAVAASVLFFSGCIVNWPRRKRLMLPGWRTAGLLAAVYASLGGPSDYADVVQPALALVGLLAFVDMALYVLRAISEARRLNEQVQNMDEHDLLALLPDEARADARRWQAGDDSKSDELGLVLHLSAFWNALRTQQTGEQAHGIVA